MKQLTAIVVRIAIVLAGIAVILLGRWLFFYDGTSYSAPPGDMPSYEQIEVPEITPTEFSDVYEEGEGIILIDLAHRNAFDKEELNTLTLRLVSRGLTVRFLGTDDDLEKELFGEQNEADKTPAEEPLDGENVTLVDKIAPPPDKQEPPAVTAFIVISPQREFLRDETDNVTEFVKRGGKLLLIDDPTRYGEMNSLSLDFGLLFEPDYLYNMSENERNYKNIFISDFEANAVTENLGTIVLYTAGSISSANSSIAFVDENTFSNRIETRQRLSPIALTQESRVLAIYDLTFISEPYNGSLDNNRLISNIADWLMAPAEATATE